MPKLLLAFVLLCLAWQPRSAAAQQASRPVYMQIFYEGPGWLAGRRVLSYSPAFRGKTEEVVQEPDSTKHLFFNTTPQGGGDGFGETTTAYATVTTEKGTFIPDRNGKMHLETAADRKHARQQEAAQLNRSLRLLETRADLGQAVVTKALNEAAADGWEVVQMTANGSRGGLVYILKRR